MQTFSTGDLKAAAGMKNGHPDTRRHRRLVIALIYCRYFGKFQTMLAGDLARKEIEIESLNKKGQMRPRSNCRGNRWLMRLFLG